MTPTLRPPPPTPSPSTSKFAARGDLVPARLPSFGATRAGANINYKNKSKKKSPRMVRLVWFDSTGLDSCAHCLGGLLPCHFVIPSFCIHKGPCPHTVQCIEHTVNIQPITLDARLKGQLLAMSPGHTCLHLNARQAQALRFSVCRLSILKVTGPSRVRLMWFDSDGLADLVLPCWLLSNPFRNPCCNSSQSLTVILPGLPAFHPPRAFVRAARTMQDMHCNAAFC